MASIALTDDQVDTQYGTRYVSAIWKILLPVSVIVNILSPWFMKANTVPTTKATLMALVATSRDNASEKNP
jgi:hypothetical protein